jgi:pimeloyl-ACP methyl ester carboxylesterase
LGAVGHGAPVSVMTAERWWAGGANDALTVDGVPRSVFVRQSGAGPTVTLLHGFPGSSLEWSGIWDRLTARRRVIAVDLLGFGRSEKPVGHRYRLDEQADVVLAAWKQLDVQETAIVAYDYGAIITQLLINRTHRPEITRAVLLNASVFPELYRPQPIQRAMLLPGVGQFVWRLTNEARFHQSWSKVFGAEHPLAPAVSHEHWLALKQGDSNGDAQRRILRYIPERASRAEEITAAVNAETPFSFLWGMADPVSGAPLAQAISSRIPGADLVTYDGIGHCPHAEIPDRIAADVLARV